MYWTTLEISAPRCALMCYPSSNITYCIACLLCIGVILLNKFNSIQFNSGDRVVLGSNPGHAESCCGNFPLKLWQFRLTRFACVFSEETLKSVGPLYLLSMPGEVKYSTQG